MKVVKVLAWFSALVLLLASVVIARAGLATNPLHYSVEPVAPVRGALSVDPGIYGELGSGSAPPEYPPSPLLFISPATQTGTIHLGDALNYTVMITSDPFWDVAGCSVQVNWNNTLIHLIGYSEGGFMQQGGAGTFSFWTVNPDSIKGGITKLSNPTPSEGTDSLMQLEFSVAFVGDSYPPPSCAITLGPVDLASWMHPERIFAPWNGSLTEVDLTPFPGWSPADAQYSAGFLTLGPSIDLYDQYPAPYGGQGPNQHSDSFAPQMVVCLYANVAFGGDRVTNKLVVFEVHNAAGDKVTILQNYSDINGIAKVCFRIPQTDLIPGGMDPSIFGWWHVTATVELDQVTVYDTMYFQVGWLVQVTSVVAVGAPYLKYSDVMNFTAFVLTVHEQSIWVLLSVDSYDAFSYPIGETAWWVLINATRVGGNSGNTTGGTYVYTDIVQGIILWARVGTATVIGYALTDYPRFGGTPYGPGSPTTLFTIKVS